MYRSFPYKSSTKFLKHSYHRNRYIRFPKNGHYGYESFLQKQKPKIIYRSYKNFDKLLVFQRELNSELLKIDLNNAELSEFTEIFLSILDKHVPKKTEVYTSK